MRFDTKIAVVVREDLATWQKLNVACFLSGGLVGRWPELAGEPYRDGSGQGYGPLIRQPILVFGASGSALKDTLGRAVARDLMPSIYTEELFATGNDTDNRQAIITVPTADLNLVGLALYGDRKAVDKITQGARAPQLTSGDQA